MKEEKKLMTVENICNRVYVIRGQIGRIYVKRIRRNGNVTVEKSVKQK